MKDYFQTEKCVNIKRKSRASNQRLKVSEFGDCVKKKSQNFSLKDVTTHI
jgi:hypothetical protein